MPARRFVVMSQHFAISSSQDSVNLGRLRIVHRLVWPYLGACIPQINWAVLWLSLKLRLPERTATWAWTKRETISQPRLTILTHPNSVVVITEPQKWVWPALNVRRTL